MSTEAHRGIVGHTFKLVAVNGTSERWRCTGCDEEKIDGPQSRCQRCGGYLTESRPWWCGNMTGHAAASPEGSG
jgi:hypothetical protein